jgi:hypothetical protein
VSIPLNTNILHIVVTMDLPNCVCRRNNNEGRTLDQQICHTEMLLPVVLMIQSVIAHLRTFQRAVHVLDEDYNNVRVFQEEACLSYVSVLPLWDALIASIRTEFTTLKCLTGNHCGIGPVSRFLKEKDQTSDICPPDHMASDLVAQQDSEHCDAFKICGSYVDVVNSQVQETYAYLFDGGSSGTKKEWISIKTYKEESDKLINETMECILEDCSNDCVLNPQLPLDPDDKDGVLAHARYALDN